MSAIPTTQKALVANAKGDLSKQVVQDWPVPTIGDTDVLVRVEATGLNPVDFKIVKYGIFIESYPTVLGSDGAGRVVSVGSKVTKTKVGARVFFQGQIGNVRTSTFQQYAAVGQDFVREIADSVNLDAAATLSVAAGTTAVGFGLIGVPLNGKDVAGKHILIWGASTSVGHVAVQAAAKLGLKVIATASPKYHDEVKALGASHVIDYRAHDAVAQIRAIAGDDLVYALDTVGKESSIKVIEALSNTKPAKIAVIAAQPEDLADALKASPNKSAERVYGSVYANPHFIQPFLDVLVKWLNSGEFKPQRVRVLGGLDAIKVGQDAQIAGTVSGEKLIAHP
ncbi:hypothetical protein HK101_003578 [Irineochytrium annulatum]|nr:hypothetical protein HK101_003578 [Irineochytrium annulatum]